MNVQDVIKRYFWVVGGITVMTCAVFAAKATAHIVEAKFLSDPAEPVGKPTTAPRPDRKPAEPARNKDGAQLAARNIFCSECTPAVVVNTDPSSIAITGLPLQLLATNVGATDKDSYATIVNTENQRQGSFSVGDKMPGASGAITAIHYKYVDFQHNGRIERVMLIGAPPVTTKTVAVAQKKPTDRDDLQAAISNGIKKINDTQYEIDKALIDKITANPMAFARGARVVPAMKNGKPEGIKLYAIRPSSPYAKLGLMNGDTLLSVNGMQLDNMEKGLEIYQKLRSSTNLEVDVTRRGKPLTIKYTIK